MEPVLQSFTMRLISPQTLKGEETAAYQMKNFVICYLGTRHLHAWIMHRLGPVWYGTVWYGTQGSEWVEMSDSCIHALEISDIAQDCSGWLDQDSARAGGSQGRC